MNYWFTQPGAPVVTSFVKRFDPQHWTVDFPRGALACAVTDEDPHALRVEARFLREGDLVGLIFESEDRHAHMAHRRETKRDYRGCRLRFRWRSGGLVPLDALNGPTLTIEGRDAGGAARAWYVRLWNYRAAGANGDDAEIVLDFDALDGGYLLPGEADRVWAGDIDRMFISLVAPGYVGGSAALRPVPAEGWASLEAIRCEGPGSVLSIGDAVAPENPFSMCTGYDDLYHLVPARVVEAIGRLGYRGAINHYVGMSHVMALGVDGLAGGAGDVIAGPALSWHRAFARAAKAAGHEVIWSVSFELLDQFCPEGWKQRTADGQPALTGWSPPSTLLSPASDGAMDYLRRLAAGLVALAVAEGLRPRLQVGEPWWWVTADNRICLYDAAARAALGGDLPVIADVRGEKSAAERAVLDAAGAMLAAACQSVAAAGRAAAGDCETLLLAYLPSILRPDAPELERANCPLGWASPAYDILQLEDYDWVEQGRSTWRAMAYARVGQRLGYPPARQHYLSGFAPRPGDGRTWSRIIAAAVEARARGTAEVFIWALPQVLRDGLTLFGEEQEMRAFDEVDFPIAIGAEASVSPVFSTEVVTSASGREWRNAGWSQARMQFDAGPGVRSDADIEALLAFFRARRGAATAFRFRDPYDHSSAGMTGVPGATDQLLGHGDGTNAEFALVKAYGDGETRRITRPVPGSVRVAIDGEERATGWTMEPGGRLMFDEAPAPGAAVRAGFLFDVPVRFAADRLEVNLSTFRAGEAPSVPLIEVRDDG